MVKQEIGLNQALHQGFYVWWTAGIDWCRNCKNSGGFCGSNSTKANGNICFCPNETFAGSCYSSGLDLGTFAYNDFFPSEFRTFGNFICITWLQEKWAKEKVDNR